MLDFARPRTRVLAVLLLIVSSVLAGGVSVWASEYKIAPGDNISIQVYGEPDLSFPSIQITRTGSIIYPFLGEVRVEGKSEVELARFIADRLREGYLIDPQVTITVSSYRPVYIEGEVESPGQKGFLVNMDVEKLIALSGGLTEEADVDAITVLREDESGSVELKAELDWEIHPGDILTIGKLPVHEIVVKKEYIYLYGEVARPGRYEYSDDLSVEKAIIIAGGFGLRASKRKISVTRGNPPVKEKKVPLEYSLLPGDVITIGASLF